MDSRSAPQISALVMPQLPRCVNQGKGFYLKQLVLQLESLNSYEVSF